MSRRWIIGFRRLRRISKTSSSVESHIGKREMFGADRIAGINDWRVKVLASSTTCFRRTSIQGVVKETSALQAVKDRYIEEKTWWLQLQEQTKTKLWEILNATGPRSVKLNDLLKRDMIETQQVYRISKREMFLRAGPIAGLNDCRVWVLASSTICYCRTSIQGVKETIALQVVKDRENYIEKKTWWLQLQEQTKVVLQGPNGYVLVYGLFSYFSGKHAFPREENSYKLNENAVKGTGALQAVKDNFETYVEDLTWRQIRGLNGYGIVCGLFSYFRGEHVLSREEHCYKLNEAHYLGSRRLTSWMEGKGLHGKMLPYLLLIRKVNMSTATNSYRQAVNDLLNSGRMAYQLRITTSPYGFVIHGLTAVELLVNKDGERFIRTVCNRDELEPFTGWYEPVIGLYIENLDAALIQEMNTYWFNKYHKDIENRTKFFWARQFIRHGVQVVTSYGVTQNVPLVRDYRKGRRIDPAVEDYWPTTISFAKQFLEKKYSSKKGGEAQNLLEKILKEAGFQINAGIMQDCEKVRLALCAGVKKEVGLKFEEKNGDIVIKDILFLFTLYGGLLDHPVTSSQYKTFKL